MDNPEQPPPDRRDVSMLLGCTGTPGIPSQRSLVCGPCSADLEVVVTPRPESDWDEERSTNRSTSARLQKLATAADIEKVLKLALDEKLNQR